MLKKLGKSITIVNAIAFAVVILVGGVSIYLTKDILHNAYKIEELSKDIVEVDSMHSDAYRLILSMHHLLIEQDELYSREAIDVISELKKKVEEYKSHELKALSGEENAELVLLDRVLDDVKGLEVINEFMKAYQKTGRFERDSLIGLEEYVYGIEENTNKINKVHLSRINRLSEESLTNMWIILFIYLVFITIGGLSIYAGHIMLLKNVVRPIKTLAAATIEFAEGKLDKRVYTDSRTEIGQLYNSFNRMAENLQGNDELLRKFNEELERKVRERTTELQSANEQLQKTQKALIRTEKIAAVGQIAAGVTHEIKNPLNSLSINAQMLIRDLAGKFGPDSPAHESAMLIKSEINRINNILEQFVKFAKFPEPRLVDNDINQVAKEVADLISESAKDSGVTVALSLQENMPVIKFDNWQMREVLINLTQNAIRAMKDGGELALQTALVDGNVIIRVKDTGEGISETNLGRIFSPFFSTREGGLGLGLSIVQRIVESHGGKINCASKLGEGTVFEVYLPMERG
ncbi:MAG: HAMP domain-containing protein [Nitrospirae bacterium]|nr:HAMP domain-containing protein [Nitrospirota bacterium]